MTTSSIAYERLGWTAYFLNIAKAVALRSTCPRLQVGAIITYGNRIITTGYNGAPPGEPHCTEVGCRMVDDHCTRTLHAEQNAIAQLNLHGYPLKKYVTHEPCDICRDRARENLIGEIIWEHKYK